MCICYGFHALEVRSPPNLERSIPRNGVKKRVVGGERQRRHGVDVVDPGGGLVPADLDAAVGEEKFGDAVGELRQRGQVRELTVFVADSPYPDLVILVGAEYFVRQNHQGLDRPFSGGDGGALIAVVMPGRLAVPHADFPVGGGSEEVFSGEDEGGSVGVVSLESGYAAAVVVVVMVERCLQGRD